jgi:hypothetical protein
MTQDLEWLKFRINHSAEASIFAYLKDLPGHRTVVDGGH